MTDGHSDGKTPEEQVKQILQIYSILPGQKPDKQFNIPQRANSIQQAPSQQQPAPLENGASVEQQEQQRVLAQQGAQQQPPVQRHEQQPQLHAQQPQAQQQYAKEEPQVQQVEQQLASVDLNHSAPQAKSNNGYEPTTFTPYEANSAYPPPPAQKQSAQAQTQETNPPSKLLHSNPAPEPTRNDKLRRKDSETQEEDEFHDAHS